MTLEDSVRRHRLQIMQRAAILGNVSRACEEAGISRTLFYRWRKRLLRYGPDGLRRRPTRPSRWPRQRRSCHRPATGGPRLRDDHS
jgi:transposase-like protein